MKSYSSAAHISNQYSEPKLSEREIYITFFHGLSKNPDDLAQVPSRWNRMTKLNLTNANTESIIANVSRAVHDHPRHPSTETARKYVQEHIEVWTSMAKPRIPTFNAMELANTLRAFVSLKIKPPNDFLVPWVTRAHQPEIVWGAEDRFKILQADTFFRLALPETVYKGFGPQSTRREAKIVYAPTDQRDVEKKYATYFFHLSHNLEDLARVPYKWDKMKDLKLSGDQLADIFVNLANAIHVNSDPRQSEEARASASKARNYAVNHINVWTDLAEPHVSGFSAEQLANTLAAFKRLRLPPPVKFMESWKQSAMRPKIVWSGEDLGKIRKADDFFRLGLTNAIYKIENSGCAETPTPPSLAPAASREILQL